VTRTNRSPIVRWCCSASALLILTAACTTPVDGRGAAAVGGSEASSSRSSGTPADLSPGAPSDQSPDESSGQSAEAPSDRSSDSGPSSDTAESTPDATPSDASAPESHDRWLPTESNPDPARDIPGVYIGPASLYAQRYHFEAPDRVAYDRYPPVGGPHDPMWAACDGVVYESPVRDEMMVHALEHGAVWIAYNPDTVSAEVLVSLRQLVPTVSYMVMSPYPGIETPLSLQAWGHQLGLDTETDPRFQQFVLALLRNPYLTPEPNATCSNPNFDITDPPPLVAEPPGSDAVPMDFTPPPETTDGAAPTTR
jgi:hypothetical protein